MARTKTATARVQVAADLPKNTKNRRPSTKKKVEKWYDAFKAALQEKPGGIILSEGPDGKPCLTERRVTPAVAWVIEVLNPENSRWEFSAFLNLDKKAKDIRFSHTMKWCLNRIKEERSYFEQGGNGIDVGSGRLRNTVTGATVMAAILI